MCAKSSDYILHFHWSILNHHSHACQHDNRLPTGCVHVKSRVHGKITDSRMFFEFSKTRSIVQSPGRLNRMWKLWGFMDMAFLWRFSALLCDTRAICGTCLSGVTPLPLFYVKKHMRNSIVNNTEPKTHLKRPQIAPKLHTTQKQPHVECKVKFISTFIILF